MNLWDKRLRSLDGPWGFAYALTQSSRLFHVTRRVERFPALPGCGAVSP
jgi:hypothetical protein